MPHIKFNADKRFVDYLPQPKPAGKCVPSWYKKMSKTAEHLEKTTHGGTITAETNTIKHCLPVRDYLTSGYIIPFWSDILIRKDSNGSFVDISPVQRSGEFGFGVGFHGVEQVQGSPIEQFTDTEKLVKFNCPWTVVTPKGYSTLFFTPFYHESSITILPAIVDTDMYKNPTNFPAIFNGDECRLHVGEPLTQSLPFKRESWTSSVTSQDFSSTNMIMGVLQGFDSPYRKWFWQRKRYR